MLKADELSVISKIGKAIWPLSSQAEQNTRETLAAVSLLKLSDDQQIEKTCVGLIERGKQAGFSLPHLSSFYRLEPEERVSLVGLHLGKWSYKRLSHVLKKNGEDLEAWLWKKRLKFLFDLSAPSQISKLTYPSGPSQKKEGCPHYDSNHPWTQRFLDREFAVPGESFVLQRHMEECDSCRLCLVRCRAFYYQIQSLLEAELGSVDFAISLKETLIASPRVPTDLPISQSLRIFFKKTKGELLFVFALVILVIIWTKPWF